VLSSDRCPSTDAAHVRRRQRPDIATAAAAAAAAAATAAATATTTDLATTLATNIGHRHAAMVTAWEKATAVVT
jgi:hypothetical protein